MTPYEIVEKVRQTVPLLIQMIKLYSAGNEALLDAIEKVIKEALDVVTKAVDEIDDAEQLPEFIQEGTELIFAIQNLIEQLKEE